MPHSEVVQPLLAIAHFPHPALCEAQDELHRLAIALHGEYERLSGLELPRHLTPVMTTANGLPIHRNYDVPDAHSSLLHGLAGDDLLDQGAAVRGIGSCSAGPLDTHETVVEPIGDKSQ